MSRSILMALINCPECNKEISDKAVSCVGCGYPIEIQKNDKIKEESKSFLTNENQNDTTIDNSKLKFNRCAIAGFILSFFMFLFSPICIISIYLSYTGLKQIKTSGERGRKLAIAGLIISVGWIPFTFLFRAVGGLIFYFF